MGYVWSMYGVCMEIVGGMSGGNWGIGEREIGGFDVGGGIMKGGIGDLVSWGIGELGTGDLIGGFDCGGDGHAD